VIIEFSHRTLAAVVTALIALLAWTAYRHLRELRWPLRTSIWAGALVLIQAGLGGLTVEQNLEEELVAAHLGLAMVLIGLLLWISIRARAETHDAGSSASRPGPARAGAGPGERVPGLKPFAAAAAVLLLCAIVAGGYVAGTEKRGIGEDPHNVNGAHLACGEQFPGCLNEGVAPFGESRLSDIHLTHRFFVYGATIAILLLLGVAFSRGARSPWMAAAAALLVVQVLLGALNVWLGEHAVLIVAHLITATLLWSTIMIIAFRLAWAPAAVASQAAPRAEPTTVTA
jgi:heme A synthase